MCRTGRTVAMHMKYRMGCSTGKRHSATSRARASEERRWHSSIFVMYSQCAHSSFFYVVVAVAFFNFISHGTCSFYSHFSPPQKKKTHGKARARCTATPNNGHEFSFAHFIPTPIAALVLFGILNTNVLCFGAALVAVACWYFFPHQNQPTLHYSVGRASASLQTTLFANFQNYSNLHLSDRDRFHCCHQLICIYKRSINAARN